MLIVCLARIDGVGLVAEEGNDLRTHSKCDTPTIVFPSLDGLVCYAQDLSRLDVRHPHVDPLPTVMVAERFSHFRNTSPQSSIH